MKSTRFANTTNLVIKMKISDSEKQHKSVKSFYSAVFNVGCHLYAAQYKIIYQLEQRNAVCYSQPMIPLIYHYQSVTNHFPLDCSFTKIQHAMNNKLAKHDAGL